MDAEFPASDGGENVARNLASPGLIGAAMISVPALTARPPRLQATGDPFVKEQALNQWRASKLVGVSVTGPNQEKIGKISDVLLDHDGNAQIIVVEPLAASSRRERCRRALQDHAMADRRAHGGDAGAAPENASTTSDATATRSQSDPAATEASQGYPDMGILNMTKAQLQSAGLQIYADPHGRRGGCGGSRRRCASAEDDAII